MNFSRFVWFATVMFSIIVLFALIAPILVVVIISFSGAETLAFPPRNFSMRWYSQFIGDPQWQKSLFVSVRIAMLSMVSSTVMGVLTALAIGRSEGKWGGFIRSLIMAPMIVPHIITAMAIYIVGSRWGFGKGEFGIIIGHTVLALPLVHIIVAGSVKGVDVRLEYASQSLGAGSVRTLRKITLPLLAPSIISAGMFAFLLSFDELLMPLFMGGAYTETLTVRIWNSLLLNVSPIVAAVSGCLIALTAVVMAADALLRSRTKEPNLIH